MNQKLKIGIMGGKGSFNEEASKKFIEKYSISDYEIVYCYTTEKVLQKLTSRKIDRGVFGIYNSKSNLVDETIKVLGHYLYDIISYHTLKISHYLMTSPEINQNDIVKIYGHPEAIKQCKKTLKEKYNSLEIVSGSGNMIDSSGIVEAMKSGKISKNIAILGSKSISEAFNLKIIDKNLQDSQDNSTTFLFVRNFKK